MDNCSYCGSKRNGHSLRVCCEEGARSDHGPFAMTPDKVKPDKAPIEAALELLVTVGTVSSTRDGSLIRILTADESNQLYDAKATLTSALAERERDAARYRWLRERVGVDYSFGGYRAFMTCGNTELNPSATDESIDLAMKDTDHDR